MALVDANGLPIALSLHDAAPHESPLVFNLVQNCWTEELPETMVGDKAYVKAKLCTDDSDLLDSDMLENFGIEVIAPHRSNRKPENKTQDTIKLQRKKRRWIVLLRSKTLNWSGFSRGCRTSGGWSSATSARPGTSTASSNCQQLSSTSNANFKSGS
jgi:hypothetical protein